MHSLDHLGPRKIIGFGDGTVFVTETVCCAWIVTIALIIIAVLLTRRMDKVPKGPQIIAELIVEKIYGMVEGTMGTKNLRFAPYVGTLIMFLIGCNMLGLFGLRPVTSDINATLSVALITFILIQVNSIRSKGFLGYLKHFAKPMPFMYPIKIIEEVALPVSLACRLFGNILAGVIIMALIFSTLADVCANIGTNIPFLQVLIPILPNLFFDVFEPLLQAYIFTMLTMVFLKNAVSADH